MSLRRLLEYYLFRGNFRCLISSFMALASGERSNSSGVGLVMWSIARAHRKELESRRASTTPLFRREDFGSKKLMKCGHFEAKCDPPIIIILPVPEDRYYQTLAHVLFLMSFLSTHYVLAFLAHLIINLRHIQYLPFDSISIQQRSMRPNPSEVEQRSAKVQVNVAPF